MMVSEMESNFAVVRIKTDISISGTTVRLSARAGRLLGLRSGMVLMLRYGGEEVYLVGVPDPEGKYYGHLYCTRGGWRCSNGTLARELLKGQTRAKYRCGDLVEYNGEAMLPIITRRNYADN